MKKFAGNIILTAINVLFKNIHRKGSCLMRKLGVFTLSYAINQAVDLANLRNC